MYANRPKFVKKLFTFCFIEGIAMFTFVGYTCEIPILALFAMRSDFSTPQNLIQNQWDPSGKKKRSWISHVYPTKVNIAIPSMKKKVNNFLMKFGRSAYTLCWKRQIRLIFDKFGHFLTKSDYIPKKKEWYFRIFYPPKKFKRWGSHMYIRKKWTSLCLRWNKIEQLLLKMLS